MVCVVAEGARTCLVNADACSMCFNNAKVLFCTKVKHLNALVVLQRQV